MDIYKYGLCSNGYSFIKKSQIESCRRIISSYLKTLYKNPKFKINVIYNTAITKKSLGARMGRGKGPIAGYIFKLHTNNIIFEFDLIDDIVLKIILNKIKYKLPVKLKSIIKYENGYCRNEDRIFR